jgi:tetratricopeptide (TPR) repeat protein
VRALELDPMLSEAHSAMASIRAREYAWQGAEDGFRRAIALNPNNALAHLELGTRVLLVQGRFDDGLKEVRQALGLDPLSPYVNTEAGDALIFTRRYEEAVEQLRKAIALDQSRNRPYNFMVRALYLQGKLPEAVAARNESLKIGTQIWATDWLGCLEVRAGRREEALRLIEEVRNSAQRSGPMTFTSRAGVTMRAGARRSSVRLAKAHACLGEAEQALALLDKALGANEPGLPEVLHAPELDALRSDPRFMVLQKRLNLQ